jgi:hypothetical protein
MFSFLPNINLRKRLLQMLVVLLCAVGFVGQVSADGVAYLYVSNYTEGDIVVYVDGYETKTLYKGYYEWFQTSPGHHKVETKKVGDPYKRTYHCVGCEPKGQIWISESDFF